MYSTIMVWWEKGVEGYQWKVTCNGTRKAMKFSQLYCRIKMLIIKVRRKLIILSQSYFFGHTTKYKLTKFLH
jgi:hypothetical protein